MAKIAVVGCGAIGLTTALSIQQKLPSAYVKIFAKDFTPDTTTDIAAGLWEPYCLGKTPPDKIYKWSKATYDHVIKLWKDGKAKEAGIILQPAIFLTDEPTTYQLPNWIDIVLGYKQFSERELETFRARYNQLFTGGMHFITFTWEGAIFLSYLQQKFLENRGEIIRKEIKDFGELKEYDVVVNCTGIEAKALTGDSKIYPVRGQVMRVKAPWISQIYLIDTENTGYIIPNTHSVVLGGTKQPVYNLEVDQQDAEDILRKCKLVLPSVQSAEVLKHKVGLRPARDEVRLETEIRAGVKIVHNYGHGGAGVTLAVGCAEEAADLVSELLRGELRSKL